MMGKQLQIPLFPEGIFDRVREAHRAQEEFKLRKELEHLKRVAAGFKAWRTRRTGK